MLRCVANAYRMVCARCGLKYVCWRLLTQLKWRDWMMRTMISVRVWIRMWACECDRFIGRPSMKHWAVESLRLSKFFLCIMGIWLCIFLKVYLLIAWNGLLPIHQSAVSVYRHSDSWNKALVLCQPVKGTTWNTLCTRFPFSYKSASVRCGRDLRHTTHAWPKRTGKYQKRMNSKQIPSVHRFYAKATVYRIAIWFEHSVYNSLSVSCLLTWGSKCIGAYTPRTRPVTGVHTPYRPCHDGLSPCVFPFSLPHRSVSATKTQTQLDEHHRYERVPMVFCTRSVSVHFHFTI